MARANRDGHSGVVSEPQPAAATPIKSQTLNRASEARPGKRRSAQLSLSSKWSSFCGRSAQRLIEPRFTALQDNDVWVKSPGEVVTIADEEAERSLARRLEDLLPGTPVVGEEASSQDPRLLSCLLEDRAWLVDPLDGTANFAAGGADWAVMVALVERGTTVASWIWRPGPDQVMYSAELGQGATRNGVPIRRTQPVPPISEMRGVVLTRFLDPVTSNLVAANRDRYGSVSSGRLCAGVDYPALIEGGQKFVLFWRTLPWDHAPGALLLSESGGVACRLDGTPYGPTQQTSGLLAAATQDAWDAVRASLLGP